MKYILASALILTSIACFANRCPTPDEIILTQDGRLITYMGWRDINSYQYASSPEQYKISFTSVVGMSIKNSSKIAVKECDYMINYTQKGVTPMYLFLIPERKHFANIHSFMWLNSYTWGNKVMCTGTNYMDGVHDLFKCAFDMPE